MNKVLSVISLLFYLWVLFCAIVAGLIIIGIEKLIGARE